MASRHGITKETNIMAKRVTHHGLRACKSPDGISIRTKDWGAEVCVARRDDTLTITIHHDGDATPMTFDIPLTSNPYILDQRTQSAAFVAPRSRDYINANANANAETRRAIYDLLQTRVIRDA
jgi:hypothetical protein